MNQRIRFLVSTLAYTRFDHNLQYRQGEYNVVDHKNVFKFVITLIYCYVFTFSIIVIMNPASGNRERQRRRQISLATCCVRVRRPRPEPWIQPRSFPRYNNKLLSPAWAFNDTTRPISVTSRWNDRTLRTMCATPEWTVTEPSAPRPPAVVTRLVYRKCILWCFVPMLLVPY